MLVKLHDDAELCRCATDACCGADTDGTSKNVSAWSEQAV
jgi:hypothetical protein